MGWGQKVFQALKASKLCFVLVLVALCSSNPTNARIKLPASRKPGADVPGFISIDCGASEAYYDEELGFRYRLDSEFIDSGENKVVSNKNAYERTDLRARNLRSFPNGTRNCYTLNPEKGKNNKYLIRASFKYGNYDGKDQVPRFDLYIGVDKWDTVMLLNSSSYTYLEATHIPSEDYINVCLVNTGYGVPFISALELRLLDNAIYEEPGVGSLSIQYRWDVGASTSDMTIRHPADVYDRIWHPMWDPVNFPQWLSFNTPTNSINSGAYRLPNKVLQSAARSKNATLPLDFSWTPKNPTSQWRFYFHFFEIEQLKNGTYREINVTLNNELIRVIELEYLEPVTITSPRPVSGSYITFSISATNNSRLPPILNALEIFEVKMLNSSLTFLDDGISTLFASQQQLNKCCQDIKKAYNITKDTWQGDPCAPREFLWEGLYCNYNNDPRRIISVNLSSSKLWGRIAPSFAKLRELKSLDLSYNDLSGQLPEFLGNLPKLRILNLTGNDFKGTIPKALEEKLRAGKLQLSVGENPHLCQSDVCPLTVMEEKDTSKKKYVIIIVASVLFFLILFGTLVILWWMKWRKQRGRLLRHTTTRGPLISRGRQFSYSEIVSITNGFRTTIGEGGFGKVYKGLVYDNTEVVVKLLSNLSKQGDNEFQSEAQILLNVHHRNLVSLIGYCDEGETKALIYEYMANKNLRQNMTDSSDYSRLTETDPEVLNWHRRLKIAVDAAQGLEYLHNGCKPTIIHRDLKPTNILLDEKMQAKISDFGLSKVFETEIDSHLSTKVAGTPGYIDPEYQTNGNLNKKSDVYSFGIILLELITGRSAVLRGPTENTHILQWIRPMIERGDIQNIIDLKLQGQFNVNSAWKAVEVAMLCVPPTAIQRPDMSFVLAELKECLELDVIANGRTDTNNSTRRIVEVSHLEPEQHPSVR